jgi:threonine/homoserine/homoserine lactone efflux protein
MPLSNDMLLSLIVFALVQSGTPGPNNVMLLASGANFGVRRTIPHMLGISVGVTVLLTATGLGLGTLLRTVPHLHDVLRWVAIAYMLWLAWKIATSAPPDSTAQTRATPLSLIGAALFQWINPKAWTMALTAVTAFTVPTNYLPSLLAMAIVFGITSVPSTIVWTVFGTGIRRLFDKPAWLRAFNIAMALLLVASIWPLMAEAVSRLKAITGR